MKHIKLINEVYGDDSDVTQNPKKPLDPLQHLPKFIKDELTRPHKDKIVAEVGSNNYQNLMIYSHLLDDFVGASNFKKFTHAISKYRTLPELVSFFQMILLDQFLKEKGIPNINTYGHEKYLELTGKKK